MNLNQIGDWLRKKARGVASSVYDNRGWMQRGQFNPVGGIRQEVRSVMRSPTVQRTVRQVANPLIQNISTRNPQSFNNQMGQNLTNIAQFGINKIGTPIASQMINTGRWGRQRVKEISKGQLVSPQGQREATLIQGYNPKYGNPLLAILRGEKPNKNLPPSLQKESIELAINNATWMIGGMKNIRGNLLKNVEKNVSIKAVPKIKFDDSLLTKSKENIQDSWARVRNLERQKGVRVTEGADPYIAEELSHGRIATRLEDVSNRIANIDKGVAQIESQLGYKNTALTEKINKYLHAMHAPERNKAIQRGAAGMSTKEAKKIISEIDLSPDSKIIKEAASQYQRMSKEVLDILVEGQVISKDLRNTLLTKYKNHVPLNRIMDETDDISQFLVDKGLNVKGTGIYSAKGSSREVNDIIGNITANLKQAIVRAEKNRVNLETLNFVRNNPQFGDQFKIIRPKAIGKTFKGNIILSKSNDPQILHLRENGKPIELFIKDPKLATVLQGIGIQKIPSHLKFVRAFTNLYSQLHTRFNPEFAIPNIVRDTQEMAVYLSSQKGMGLTGAGKTAIRSPLSIKAVTDSLRGIDSEGARLYKQMRLDGGTTGGMALSTRKSIDLDIEAIRKLNRSNPRQLVQKLIESFDSWNTIFEDATRLSVYKQALQNGLSRTRAASLAKNATINFNRKGTATPILNSLYMFSNASIQGTTKMLTALRNPKTLGLVLTGVGGAVHFVNQWNDRIDPDWRENISKWDRINSLPILIPTKEGITTFNIPVSWGLKPIKVTFDYISDAMEGKGMDTKEITTNLTQAFLDAYNPVGGTDIVSSIAPTIIDIPLEIVRNKAWHGGLIKPDWMSDEPGHKQMWKDTEKSASGQLAVDVTQNLSEKTGGKIEISPTDLLYAYNQYIGGAGRFATKTVDTLSSLFEGEKLDLNTIPFSSRFLKHKTQEQIDKVNSPSSVFFKIKKDISKELSSEEKATLDKWIAAKPKDVTDAQSFLLSMAEASEKLARPDLLRQESQLRIQTALKTGQALDPFYSLTPEQQQTVLRLQTFYPGDKEKSTQQTANISWLKPYWVARTAYFDEMVSKGIMKADPKYEAENITTPEIQKKLDTYYSLPYGTGERTRYANANPDLVAYWEKKTELTNKKREDLGLSLLEEYQKFGGGGGWKNYWKKYRKKITIKKLTTPKVKRITNIKSKALPKIKIKKAPKQGKIIVKKIKVPKLKLTISEKDTKLDKVKIKT